MIYWQWVVGVQMWFQLLNNVFKALILIAILELASESNKRVRVSSLFNLQCSVEGFGPPWGGPPREVRKAPA